MIVDRSLDQISKALCRGDACACFPCTLPRVIMHNSMLLILVLFVIGTIPTANSSRQWPYKYKMPNWIKKMQNDTATTEPSNSDESSNMDKSTIEPTSVEEDESKGWCDISTNYFLVQNVEQHKATIFVICDR